jgi:tetratricopeptide (TPR) repeat protein
VVFLQGRYSRAERWLRRAAELAGDDAAEQGRIACALGSVLSDTAEYGAALERLGEALALNRAAGDARQAAYTLSMIGRWVRRSDARRCHGGDGVLRRRAGAGHVVARRLPLGRRLHL